MIKKVLLTSVFVLSFASTSFAHYCYVEKKPSGAGAVTLEELEAAKVNPNGKPIIKGAFLQMDFLPEGTVDLNGTPVTSDIFIRKTLPEGAISTNGNEHGVKHYVIPDGE
jgi:hypothetical protein